MQKTRIEWCQYVANPIKGLCPVGCSYCYARKFYKRFHWDETIRFEPREILKCAALRESTRIFVGSTIELFGPWVKPEWLKEIMAYCKGMNWLTFIFLTKQPQNLPREFPPNCWIGVSVTDQPQLAGALVGLAVVQAKVKFLSFEPLLKEISFHPPYALDEVQWVIIGQQTPYSVKTAPKIGWIQEILVAAHNAGDLPIFVKDNLQPLIDHEWPGWTILQEFPDAEQKKGSGQT